MTPDRPETAWIRALLNLPEDSSERLAEEWMTVRRRIEVVHGVPVPRDTEPSGGPRFPPDEQ